MQVLSPRIPGVVVRTSQVVDVTEEVRVVEQGLGLGTDTLLFHWEKWIVGLDNSRNLGFLEGNRLVGNLDWLIWR